VINLSKNMAMDFARHNIRVNALCPGGTSTPRVRSYMARFPAAEKMMTEVCAMQRMAEPHEIAKPAVFLASDDASFITGTTLIVDGGMTAGKHFDLFDSI
jgi:NAD(P)-dependent dehydrogenase (short-subunit alcohol dehydrogenase family)